MSHYCKTCDTSHPLTKEYWYFNPKNGQTQRCRTNKKKYDFTYMKVWKQKNYALQIVCASRLGDRRRGTYVEDGYITKAWVLDQQAWQKDKCYYCKELMLYGEGINRNKPLGLTVERMNNDVCHLEANCVLCHKKCQGINTPQKIKIVFRRRKKN